MLQILTEKYDMAIKQQPSTSREILGQHLREETATLRRKRNQANPDAGVPVG